jgi:hypothetical protein
MRRRATRRRWSLATRRRALEPTPHGKDPSSEGWLVMKVISTVLAIGSGILLVPGAALADDTQGSLSAPAVPAVTRALEIGVAGGYAQGAGDVGSDLSAVDELAGAGGSGELQLGYRVIPRLTLGVYGAFSGYAQGDEIDGSTDVLGATAGIRADYHILPAATLDPWVSLSTGWRGLWLTPDTGKNTSLQGFEIARLQIGLDYRITPEVAIAPVLGASVSMFTQQDGPGQSGYQDIDDPKANVFFFAGLLARFDVLGDRVR